MVVVKGLTAACAKFFASSAIELVAKHAKKVRFSARAIPCLKKQFMLDYSRRSANETTHGLGPPVAPVDVLDEPNSKGTLMATRFYLALLMFCFDGVFSMSL